MPTYRALARSLTPLIASVVIACGEESAPSSTAVDRGAPRSLAPAAPSTATPRSPSEPTMSEGVPLCRPHPEGPCETTWTSGRTGVTQIERLTYEDGRLVLRETRRADSPVRTSRRTFTYDEHGFLVREVGETPRGSGWTRYVRDDHGNATETVASLDGVTENPAEEHRFTLDRDGRVEIDERWAIPRYLDGRVVTRRTRAGSVTYTRDEEGRVRTSSEETSGTPFRVCTHEYDAHGTLSRLECRYERSAASTVFTYPAEYDACGNLIARRELRESGEESERWEHRYECAGDTPFEDWVPEVPSP